MVVTFQNKKYQWIENWARIPNTSTGQTNGRTHGVAVSKTGSVIVFHQASPAVLFFSPEGILEKSWGTDFLGAHGLTLVEENGTEYLWLTDQNSAVVVKMTLSGEEVQRLERPPHPRYLEGGKYAPTWVAVAEKKVGGNGEIIVADGYGQSLVHFYKASGEYLYSIDGTEGSAGALRCPHGVWFDTRKKTPELYITDRSHNRIQVYNLEGKFLRAFTGATSKAPCCFSANAEYLLIPDLQASIKLYNHEDVEVANLGDNEAITKVVGWPNFQPPMIQEGKFNSPHGGAIDAKGNIYIVEWIVGGRITKLMPV